MKAATKRSLSFMKNLVIEDKSERPIKMVSGDMEFIHFDNDVKDVNIAWFSKPKKRVIEYQGKKHIYHCPRTVWLYRGGNKVSLYVVFSKRKERELYKLSVPNVYADGSVCWGNVKLPRFETSEDLKKMEDLFWNSRFSNHMFDSNFACPVDEFYAMDKEDQWTSHICIGKTLSQLIKSH
jgi:hypothetical protein